MQRIKRYILIALGALVGVSVLTFALRNSGLITVDYFFGTTALPLWVIVAVSSGLGWGVPQLFGLIRWSFVARERRKLLRRIDALEVEVVGLRNAPLQLGLTSEAPRTSPAADSGRRKPLLPSASEQISSQLASHPVMDLDSPQEP